MFTCIKCGKEFSIEKYLNQHYKRKTPCDKKDIHKCNICLKEFASKSSLSYHQNNRKTPCKKVDPILENYELRLENERLQHANIINNINTTNNNQIYNIHINGGDKYYKNQVLNQISDTFKVKGEEISRLMLQHDHDDENEFKNITIFTDIIIKICFNIQRPENWRFVYDKIAELLKIKINNSIVEFPDHFPEMIYIIYKYVVQYKELDPDIIEFYKKYITNYENNNYSGIDNKKFINECYEILKAQYMNMITIIDQRLKNNEVEVLPIKPIIEFKLNRFGGEDLSIMQLKAKNYKGAILIIMANDNNYDETHNFKYRRLRCNYNDLPSYDLFIYLIKIIYMNKKENKTIKYVGNSLYVYNGETWDCNVENELDTIFKKIHQFIYEFKIHIPDELIDFHKEKYDKTYNCYDSDDDSIEEVKDHFNEKYKLMLRYVLTDDKFDKMVNHFIKPI